MYVDLKQNISKEGFPFYLRNTKNPLSIPEKFEYHDIWINGVQVSVIFTYVYIMNIPDGRGHN